MSKVQIQIANKLVPFAAKKKRLKIALGGRGASKSIAFADLFLDYCNKGQRLMCAREFQNSIDDSVHGLMKARRDELGFTTVSDSATGLTSRKGGEIFYKGLSRNPDSIKSTYGIDKVWIEEGSTISQKTIDILLPTIREEGSEIWVSMNRGSSKDPIYKSLIKQHEKSIQEQGYYEDENILIVEINYFDNPWFPDVLEKQRLRDYELLSRAKYNHIWLGHLSDTVDNAIIEPEWFDACVDAHIKLGFDPEGVEVVSHDPADSGDAKAISYRHGSVFKDVQQTEDFDVNTACDWATDYAIDVQADVFIWDGGGLGLSLRRDISNALDGKHTHMQMFNGSHTAMNPNAIYEELGSELQRGKTNKEAFFNQRAQAYWLLRDRMYATWLAVTKNKYTNPDEMISFSSDIKDIDNLRSELCRIPRKRNGNNKIQLMSKDDMKKADIESPNMSDCCAMSMMIDTDELNTKKRIAHESHEMPEVHNYF